MKRSPHLQPLSHDHYDGLTVARRLGAGLEKRADPGVMAAYVAHFWRHGLAEHFRQEETLLAPVLAQAGGAALADRMQDEHRVLQALVEALDEETDPSGSLETFARTLPAHIRFEERELFPFLEQHAGEAVLRRLGAQLQAAHTDAALAWEPAFWA